MDQTVENPVKVSAKVSLKSVALPAEHGGWGFLLEPILLGLLVAPSVAGFWLSLAALGVFLIHQPLKITLKDRLKGKRYARTLLAERFTFAYGVAAGTSFLLAIINAQHAFWIPLLLAVPFALVQTRYEIRNEGREMLPEVTGALALGAVAPAIALISGWELLPALVLWLLLGTRSTSSILYVRSRLRLERGKEAGITQTLIVHLASLILIAGLAYTEQTSWWSGLALVILLIRAGLGLSALRKPRKPKFIGFSEMAYGLVSVILFSL